MPSQTEDERVYCAECECFEPMRDQRSKFTTIGSCHLAPPIFKSGEKISHWPTVVKEYGFCYSGIRKDSQ